MDEFANWRDALSGIPFLKMTGSGNDFVFFDGRIVSTDLVTRPEVVQAICNRHNGIGADGIVVLEPAAPSGDVRILYFNSDGTPADLCGNATLCSLRLSSEIGLGRGIGMSLLTPAGVIAGRLRGGLPEIDLQPVSDVRPLIEVELSAGELRVGFVTAGIPHVIVLCERVDSVAVNERGPTLRHHPATGTAGANVNWVSREPDGAWRYRTFERGVEGETLACGTGAVATAIMLTAWGLSDSPVRLTTRSGRLLEVALRRSLEATGSLAAFAAWRRPGGVHWPDRLRSVLRNHLESASIFDQSPCG